MSSDLRQQFKALIPTFTGGGGGGSGVPPTTPMIYNLSMPTANNEYSQPLAGTVKKFTVKMRDSGSFRYAYAVGGTATQYVSVPKGCSVTVDIIELTTGTLFLRSPQASQIAEIETWT